MRTAGALQISVTIALIAVFVTLRQNDLEKVGVLFNKDNKITKEELPLVIKKRNVTLIVPTILKFSGTVPNKKKESRISLFVDKTEFVYVRPAGHDRNEYFWQRTGTDEIPVKRGTTIGLDFSAADIKEQTASVLLIQEKSF